MTVVALRSLTPDCLTIPLSAETDNEQYTTKNTHLSDREKAGLRRSVRLCVEEQKSGSLTTEYDVIGRMIGRMQGSKQVSTRKYDSHGYLREATEGNEVTTYSYNDEGKLLSVAIHNESGSKVYNYSYDDNARLTTIANTTDASNRVGFVYDAQGGRTMTMTIQRGAADEPRIPADAIPGLGSSMDQLIRLISLSQMSFFVMALEADNDIPGGSEKAVWNDHDQLTELHSYDAQGQLVHRLILTYDSNGKVIEVKSVKEDLKSQMLAGISDPRLSAKEKQAIQSIPLSCWDELSQFSASYTYDSEGHVTEERNMTGKRIDRNVVRSYNDHGDLASESIDGRPVRRDDYVRRYDYQYDSYGNWTQKTTNTAFFSSDGTPRSESVTIRRRLSYW